MKRKFIKKILKNGKAIFNKPRKDDESPEQEESLSEKKDRYNDEFYYKILNKNRYILLYDEINSISADVVCSKLRAMNYLDKKKPIHLEISSPGGWVSYGLAILDTIEAIEAPVYTIINGEVCSMAAMISIIGKKRFMTKNAVFMQHSTSDLIGDYLTHIKDRTSYLIKMEKRMTDILKKHTKLNTRQLNQIKNGELWLFSDECLKYGIIDKII